MGVWNQAEILVLIVEETEEEPHPADRTTDLNIL
jgi:hypothetical protein